ncbi:MAG: undecaprenyl/decaprenyl-phosphate alpha-N-acetylglucosaminyl 1-phosphate transferase [Bacteroidetes bacterium]|nr:undecaprenyl/decaprenyl-phosphate alpha-N-acetylglucosaminyl 1-phosphate transferase [Bacteroidota bacterium]
MVLNTQNIIIFALSAFIVSYSLNRIFLRFSTNLGTRSSGEVRFASTSKPSVGGFTFYISFLLCFISINLLFPEYLAGATKQTTGLFAASSLGFMLGFADDAYNTNPVLKFSGQIVCGLILVFTDLYIPLFPPGMTGSFVINSIFTIIWVIGIMNSLNMLDNMDAITTSISICIMSCGLYMLSLSDFKDVFTTLLLIGGIATLVGFLFYNWYPAKMYMGDTGSQFIGVFLAAIAIKLFWNFKDPGTNNLQIKQFLIPLLAFIMPIIDTTTVFIRRIARGQSPFTGGADHTTHHLAYLGLSVPAVGILFITINMLSILFIHLLTSYLEWNYYYSFIVLGYFLILFLIMQFLYDLGGKKKPQPQES